MDSINKTKIIFIVTQSEFGGAQRYIFELISRLNPEKVEEAKASSPPTEFLKETKGEKRFISLSEHTARVVEEDKSSSSPFATARVYDILVAAGQGDKELFKKVQNLPVKTLQLKHLKRNPSPVKAVFSILEMLGLLKKEKPDILFLCSTTAGILGSIAGSIYKSFNNNNSRFKIIYRIGGWAFNDPRNWFLNKLILWTEKITAGFKDKIIVNSEFDRQTAIKNKICPPEKIVKIYNGINPEKLNFLPKQQAQQFLFKNTTYKIQDTRYTIGTVANFYRTKGINYLIESIKLLEVKYKLLGVKCIVIGDGKQRPKLENLIKKLGLENKVFLAGRIPNAYKYLKAFDVFVLPSLKEGFPWIILEAMAVEVPIIATKVGALPEIIENNKHGILIEPKNAEKLAENIFKLIKNPELAMSFKTGGKEKLKKFSASNMVRQTESLF